MAGLGYASSQLFSESHPPLNLVTFDPVYGFLAVLLAYMVYSEWVRLDSRYPVAAALILLVIDAVIDAAGDTNLANVIAVYVFFLLAAGVFLLLVDHVREARAHPETPPSRKRKPSVAEPGSGSSDKLVE